VDGDNKSLANQRGDLWMKTVRFEASKGARLWLRFWVFKFGFEMKSGKEIERPGNYRDETKGEL